MVEAQAPPPQPVAESTPPEPVETPVEPEPAEAEAPPQPAPRELETVTLEPTPKPDRPARQGWWSRLRGG
jgi:hypothetical protein